jgi:hypothetical protein
MYEHSMYRLNGASWLLLLVCGWMIGCEAEGDDDVADDDTTATDDDDNDFDCANPLDFQELVQSENYGEYGNEGWVDCHAIAVLMLESQLALETAYQELLPSVPLSEIPMDVDFDTEMALLSYAEDGCTWDGNRLTVNSVCLEEGLLLAHETLVIPGQVIEVSAKVFNLTKFPAVEYENTDIELTVEYLKP